MPKPVDDQPPAAVVAYYRTVESTLVTHLRNRTVQGFGRDVRGVSGSDQPAAVDLHIADLQDLDEAIRSGITYFLLPGLTAGGLISLRVRPGQASGIDGGGMDGSSGLDGSGMDTVATATLALATSMSYDGIAATAMTDGAGGLYLIGFAVGPVGSRDPDSSVAGSSLYGSSVYGSSAVAGRYARLLCDQAPEIATTDAADSGGRALVEPLPQPGGRAIPAPYSLVTMGGVQGVAAPLTMDEVAAASAGMALDIEPADLVGRLANYGDLAAALGEATTIPA